MPQSLESAQASSDYSHPDTRMLIISNVPAESNVLLYG